MAILNRQWILSWVIIIVGRNVFLLNKEDTIYLRGNQWQI